MIDRLDWISPQVWARTAGLALLLVILSGTLSTHLVVPGDATATAHNIMAHERRFRVGLAGELIMLNSDIVLAGALYALLRPVNAGLALLGSFWRVVNVAVQGFGIVAALVGLDLLDEKQYLPSFTLGQVYLMAHAFADLHGTAMLIGLLFFSLGAATHGFLLFKSRMIPRLLSASYLLVASVLLFGSFTIIVDPAADAVIDPWFILPDFVVELLVALWLLIKGVDKTRVGG